MTEDQPEESTELARFASGLVDEQASRDPILATYFGVEGSDDRLPRFTTERYEGDADFLDGALRTVRGIAPAGDPDRIAKAVMLERLERSWDVTASGEIQRCVSVINSPLSDVRQVFEVMAPERDPDATLLTSRLADVRPALQSWQEGLRDVAARGELPARRHLEGLAQQADTYAGGGAFAGLAAARADAAADPERLVDAGRDADAACAELAAFLRDELAPRAAANEGIGERHQRWASYFTGAALDPADTYAWGWEELSRLNARMWELAAVIAPGAHSLAEVAAACDEDDDGAVFGVDEVLARLRDFVARTVEQLDGRHFDIPAAIRFCDVRTAPEGSAAAPYYIEPSEDLRRPGTTWLPTLGRSRFPWWRLAATWYHEAVPGHHLQSATALLATDRLNRFQRQSAWTSGYGEGWALYAERLMDELGAFENPADELGFLEGQALRAARVVVDFGLHLGFAAPDDLGELGRLGDVSGRPWTPEMAVELLVERAISDRESAVSEVDRYLGMPAQAISYKVGERAWLTAREDARARLGPRFDLKAFHTFALRLGPMGLDPFADELARFDGTA